MRKLALLIAIVVGLGACGTKLPAPNYGTYKCTSYNTNERCQTL